MALRDFDKDIVNAPETAEGRIVRAQLRLSDHWKFVKNKVNAYLEPYSDEYPDLPDTPHLDDKDGIGHSTIYITYKPRKHYHCPVCGAECKVICYEMRCYHHLPDKGHSCELLVNLPKYKCDSCGGTPQQRFPAAFGRKSYTRMLAYNVVEKLKTCSRSKVAECFGISTDVVSSIVRCCISKGLKDRDLSYVSGVYVDETQLGSGNDYLSIFLDQFHKVIYIYHDRGMKAIQYFSEYLAGCHGNPELVMFFSADMSSSYESGIVKCFPNATLIFDRFHLVKSVNDALNDVRKRVLKRDKSEPLKSLKYVVLTRSDNQNEKQAERLKEIRFVCPDLALAFDMKEAFCYIIKIENSVLMRELLISWIQWVRTCGPKEFIRKAKFFERKLDRIIAWTKYRISNSVSEGVNKNIQDIRRQACGYQNVQNMMDMIFLRQGNLELTY